MLAGWPLPFTFVELLDEADEADESTDSDGELDDTYLATEEDTADMGDNDGDCCCGGGECVSRRLLLAHSFSRLK